jgi:predicted aconitase with swiveling domain
MKAEMLIEGSGAGPLLRLAAPLSFWGGVDPQSGRIIDVRHPDCGRDISGTVLAMPGAIGSSSSSAVLLELVRIGKAPAAILMEHPDAILLLGLVVAREMGWPHPPAARLAMVDLDPLTDAKLENRGQPLLQIAADGTIS